jgi:hypothetical protein
MIGYITETLFKVKYKPGFWVERCQFEHGVIGLRWATVAPCSVTGVVQPWYGRWFGVDMDATPDQVVKTLLLAIKQFEEHECLEHFKFDGKCVVDPHGRLV